MKYQLSSIFVLAGLILVWGCEPAELPEPEQEGIPFSMEGSIDGESVSLGLNSPDYIMDTEAQYLTSDSIWTLFGRLGPDNPSAGPALSIRFRYPQQGRQPSLATEQLFDSLGWEFFQPDGVERESHPLNISVQASDSLDLLRVYSPLITNNVIESRQQASVQLPQRKKFFLCIEYRTEENQNGRFCSTIRPTNMGKIPVLNWSIEEQDGQSASLKASITPEISSSSPLYSWQDEPYSPDSTFLVTRPEKIKLESRSVVGGMMIHEKDLVQTANREFSTYGEDLSLFAEWKPPIQILDRIQPGTVRLRYTDASGERWFYRPSPVENPELEVLDFKPFNQNELGQSTIALRIRLRATLYNNSGESIEIENLKGWFAVALPS